MDCITPRRPEALQGLAATLALVLAIKLAGLVLDPSLRVFLGDSGSYLHTALTGWVPPDRSYLYGLLIGATAVPAQSAFALVALQSLFGAATATLLYGVLVFGLRVRVGIAMAAAVALSIEPAQWFYERMMMAESAGLLAFAGFFAAVLAYVHGGRFRWIALYAVLGVLAVALRLSSLPVVLVLGSIAPVVRSAFEREPDRGRPLVAVLRLGLHLVVALALTTIAHSGFKRWYGQQAGVRPDYTAHTGMFRLGLVVPLVKPEHFRNTGVSPAVLDEVPLPLDDPRNRERHLWTPEGLWEALRARSPHAEAVARKVSIRAARDDPFGLVRMGASTLADYFDRDVVRGRLDDDLGKQDIAPIAPDLLRHLRYDIRGTERADSPAARWFDAGAPWLTFCLFALAPLALAAFWSHRHRPGSAPRALLLLVSLGLVASQWLFSHIVSFRYLHPLPWFVLANAALLLQAWRLRNTQRRELA